MSIDLGTRPYSPDANPGTLKPDWQDGDDAIGAGDNRAIWALHQIQKARPIVLKHAKQAKEADRFAAGHHFTKADLEQLKFEGRPHAAFNAAQKWLRYISGLERKSRMELRFEPRDVHVMPQLMASDTVTNGYNWVVQGEGDSERSRAFEDCLRRGMGWTDVQLDRSIDASGIINLVRVDGHEMIWDTRSTKPCLADARWIARERQVPKGEALLRWPQYRNVILANLGISSDNRRPDETILINERQAVPVDDAGNWPSVSPGHVRVIEFQWYDEVVGMYFVNHKGEEDWLDEDAFRSYHKKFQRVFKHELDHDRMIMRQYKRMTIIGRTVVYGPFDLPGKRFTFNCITGQWDDEEMIWYGFMRLLIDPQRYMTKFANQVMEIITRSAKGGVFMEEGATNNPAEFEQTYARTGSVSRLLDGGIAKIKEKSQPDIPPAAIKMFEVCNQMLREVTGINPEVAMGMGAGDVPMVTLQQRQAASQVLLAQEFDSLDRYRVMEAKTIFDFLKEYIADNRWIRVGGPYAAQSLQLIKAPFFLEYDVVMDEGTRDPTVRQQYMATIEKLAPTLMRTNNFLPEFIDFFPLPASLKFALKQAMAKQAEQQQRMAALGLQMGGRGKPTSIEQIQANAQKTKADAMLAQAKAAALVGNMQTSRIKAAFEAIIKSSAIKQQQAEAQQQAGQQHMQGASQEAMGILNVAQKHRAAEMQADVAREAAANKGGSSE